MDYPTKCYRCGGENLEGGQVLGGQFLADRQKLLTFSFYGALRASACLDCGAVALTVDPEKVRGALKESS